ncbi:MAG: GntR family transcriptional regulator, partial [Pseudomonadota bacterium]
MTDSTAPARFSFAPGVPEQVADYIQAQIVRGELAPGERIAEARVTAALNVSRGPVREALQRLAARHLVVLAPRRGARVSSFDIDDVRGLFDVYVALVIRLAQRVAETIATPPKLDVPEFIPPDAPFDADQRLWLNGMFAGLYALTAGAKAGDDAPAAGTALTILYGSQ